MPRLLLVDDNPSIHRIAESLLAHTDVDLVCVDSAAEALDRIGKGERFDVALVDTAMPGMDGWTLLSRLRSLDETARMPIALMAGVLDPVDPAKLAKAPVQGFLKKPIELRELGDRVKTLLATPVTAPEPAPPPSAPGAEAPEPESAARPSPFITVPATPARDLVRGAEALPEFRPEPAATPDPAPDSGPAEDLLVLTAEDLWPEEAPVTAGAAPSVDPVPAAAPEINLELEELDLESLQDLTAEVPPSHPVAEAVPFHALPVPVDEDAVLLAGLDELDGLPTGIDLPPLPEPAPEPLPEAEVGAASGHASSAHLAAAAGAAGLAAAAAALLGEEESETPVPHPTSPEPVAPEGAPEAPLAPEAAPEVASEAPAAAGQAPAVAGQATVSPEQAQALLQALLADPVLVDALVKAVVARMGDQVIREIAWEVMPDLAGKLQN